MKTTLPKRMADALILIGAAVLPALACGLLQIDAALRWGLRAGILMAGLNAIISFLFLALAFRRSNRIFFGAFFAGVTLKLAALGGAFWLAATGRIAEPVPLLITLAAATAAFNAVEVGFFRRWN